MSIRPPATIAPARLPEDIEIVRALFSEYMASLAIDLSFQDAEKELADLPGKYAPPRGGILLARDAAANPLGCVALRPLGRSGECEMKRLYVRPEGRGQDLGRRLALAIIAHAKSANYALIRLDTLASMRAAQALYLSLGFHQTAPYYDNPLAGTLYLALDL